MKKTYIPKGVCANKIEFEIEGGIIRGVRFSNGCEGNLTGISRLVEGMDAEKAKTLLEGVTCGRKKTSCPDQLAKAIGEALE